MNSSVVPQLVKKKRKNVPNVSITLIDPDLEDHISLSTINYKYEEMTTITASKDGVPAVFIDLSEFMTP